MTHTRSYLTALATIVLSTVAATCIAPGADATVNYGNSYGYTSITHTTNLYPYSVVAHDLKADGRRYCSQTGNSTLTPIVQVCATTSSGPKGVNQRATDLYWHRNCWQTHPNVNDNLLTCDAWARINLALA